MSFRRKYKIFKVSSRKVSQNLFPIFLGERSFSTVIFPLSGERDYNETLFFNNVERVYIDDHNVPKLRWVSLCSYVLIIYQATVLSYCFD